MGRTWLAGEVVLKQVDDEAEHALGLRGVRRVVRTTSAVPRPLGSTVAWSFDGWGAHVLVPGGERPAPATTPAGSATCGRAFHAVVPRPGRGRVPRPRDDAWSYGDRVAWEGCRPEGYPDTLALLERALAQVSRST